MSSEEMNRSEQDRNMPEQGASGTPAETDTFKEKINTETTKQGKVVPQTPVDILDAKIVKTRRAHERNSFIIEVIVTLAVFFLIFSLIIGLSKVSGASMEPNYLDGDRVAYLRCTSTYERGDVIVFHTEKNRDLIKRVIAVEGDTVDIDTKTNAVIVNGEVIKEKYIYEPTQKYAVNAMRFPLQVSKESVFVLGDNRTNSNDSRGTDVGLVSKDQIAGKVFLRLRWGHQK